MPQSYGFYFFPQNFSAFFWKKDCATSKKIVIFATSSGLVTSNGQKKQQKSTGI
jgi:hypothetical protein